MIGWLQIGYGAALSALVAGVGGWIVARDRCWAVAIGAAVAAAAGPLAWNAVLRAAHGQQFFTDAPLVVMPASWQDLGSGVFALAAATVVLGVMVLPGEAARRVAGYALLCGLAAFLVDVFLY